MHEDSVLDDCAPNLNSVTIAGQLKACTPMKADGQDLITALAFTVIYRKHWPNGQVQDIPIRCYVSGRERVRQLDQQAQELQGLEARVETQAKKLQGLEQRIREVESRLAQGQPPALPS